LIDLPLLRELLSPYGQEVLAEAALASHDEVDFLASAQALGRRFPDRLARAALEQAILRGLARAKFSTAERLYFTREALEQATVEAVAAHRADRLASLSPLFDLGCGIGGDTLALAKVAQVVAVDRDELRLALMQANAAALGLDRQVLPVLSDLRSPGWEFPRGCGVFFDPARRSGGLRRRSSEAYLPPLTLALAWAGRVGGMSIKVSPAIDLLETRQFDAEVEFVSFQGDLKEATLWTGALKSASRRATLLPGPHTLTGRDEPELAVSAPRQYLMEPDAAVLRAGLVRTLGAHLGAAQIDSTIAFLTSDQPIHTPFARAFRVLEVIPFSLKRVREALRARGVGRVTIKKRGSAVDVDDLTRRLRLKGDEDATLVLTRVLGRPVAMIVEAVRPLDQPADGL
jgi:hypothetical protein